MEPGNPEVPDEGARPTSYQKVGRGQSANITYAKLEFDMSILDQLENINAHIPEDAITVWDVVKKTGWPRRRAYEWLYQGWKEGRFERGKKITKEGRDHQLLYYWEKKPEEDRNT